MVNATREEPRDNTRRRASPVSLLSDGRLEEEWGIADFAKPPLSAFAPPRRLGSSARKLTWCEGFTVGSVKPFKGFTKNTVPGSPFLNLWIWQGVGARPLAVRE